ncbi:unnamed protein product [Trifolium pratense]|uniref:Uncharacterized protein n=1 Tax=Trifolium pratense TaxID=57577 RepID=A0ACB0KKZ9_TRIPR|nr:unnamed protein product [Trifolium pratense]
MEVKMFNLKAESQRLKEEVADHAKVLAELDTTRAKIEQLNKVDIRCEAEQNKDQIITQNHLEVEVLRTCNSRLHLEILT